MAREVVVLCDFDGGGCRRPAASYRVWRVGDRQAAAIDLCDEHAAPLLEVIEKGQQVELPARPRKGMEVTELRATPRTEHLKKKG